GISREPLFLERDSLRQAQGARSARDDGAREGFSVHYRNPRSLTDDFRIGTPPFIHDAISRRCPAPHESHSEPFAPVILSEAKNLCISAQGELCEESPYF